MTNKPNDVRVPCELLPCPYCGRAARYVAEDYVDNSGEPWPFAECDVCNTGAPVELWNKRAQPADQQGEPVAITELRHIFDCNKGADRTLVISKKLAAQLLADQPATAKVDEHKLNIVVDKVDDICEKFEMENQHSHPTYKRLKRLHYELARAKLSGSQS